MGDFLQLVPEDAKSYRKCDPVGNSRVLGEGKMTHLIVFTEWYELFIHYLLKLNALNQCVVEF